MTRPLVGLLGDALASGDDRDLRAALLAGSRLPGPRMNLELVGELAAAVGGIVAAPDPPVARLEAMLDAWATILDGAAPGDQPAVILPCAAVAAYGEVGAVRPEWWSDEIAKLHHAAGDSRWRVREVVAQALQRLLEADWPRTVAALHTWSADDDPLVLRAVAAGVAEPRLLGADDRAGAAAELQRRVLDRYRAFDARQRRGDAGRTLRQALGYTVSVIAAATGDLAILDELAAADDADLRWIARQNLGKSRLRHLINHE